jgi:peptidoglycan/LPS O-acetylase OafA/YrhL
VRKLGYRPALDGVRALAIAPVVGMHAFGWPREGGLGVEIFFVLSGFLITTLLLEERVATATISFTRFYRRRAARLAPGLVLMLAVYAIVTHGADAWAVVIGLTYTSNIAILVDAGSMPWALGHLWSLAQEEQFYLLWPPLLFLITRVRNTLLPKALALLLLAVMLERVSLVAHGSDIHRIYFAPDTHAEPILVGCLFGALHARWSPAAVRSWGGPAALSIVVGSFFAAQWLWILSALSPVRTLFFFACGFLILAAAQGDVLSRVLGSRPLTFLGQISYSLYLWHLPLLVAFAGVDRHFGLRTIAAVGAAVVVATASRYFIELPFLAQRRGTKTENVRAAAAAAPA